MHTSRRHGGFSSGLVGFSGAVSGLADNERETIGAGTELVQHIREWSGVGVREWVCGRSSVYSIIYMLRVFKIYEASVRRLRMRKH